MKIREEYELTGEDLEIADTLRKGSLSVIDKMLSDLRENDGEYFIRFYPNEYSLWGNELFRDILGLLKEKEGEYPFCSNFEKNNVYFYLEKLPKSESVYITRKNIQKILEIGRNLVEGCGYLMPYELDKFKRRKEEIMEEKMEDERECRKCGERKEFYERD